MLFDSLVLMLFSSGVHLVTFIVHGESRMWCRLSRMAWGLGRDLYGHWFIPLVIGVLAFSLTGWCLVLLVIDLEMAMLIFVIPLILWGRYGVCVARHLVDITDVVLDA